MIPHRRRRRKSTEPATELSAVVRLWMLRMLVPLNAQRQFVMRMGFQDDGLAAALGLGKWVDVGSDDFDTRSICAELRELHAAAEKSARSAKVPKLLSENVGRLGTLVGLNQIEQRVLEFVVMLHNERGLDDMADRLGSLSSLKVHHVLAVVLGMPQASVRAAMEGQSMLTRSGLLSLDRFGAGMLRGKLDLLSDRFADHVASSRVDPIGFLRDTVLRPYVGAGLDLIYYDGEAKWYDDPTAARIRKVHKRMVFGLYAHAGVTYQLSEDLQLGLDIRQVFGTPDTNFFFDGDLDYQRVSLFLGWGG